MKWQDGLNPAALNATISKTQESKINVFDDGGLVAAKASEIYAQNPWLKPETILSLAHSNASASAIETAGYISGTQQAEEMPTQQSFWGADTVLKSVGKVFQLTGFAGRWIGKGLSLVVPDSAEAPIRFVGDTLYDVTQDLKPAARYGTAAFDLVPEMAQYLSSKTLGTLYDVLGGTIEYGQEPQGGFWDSTSIGQLLANPELQGSGFLINETLREAQAREARARRGMINGSAFTTGRMVASTFFEPESAGYSTVSGFIDAVQMMAIPDPSKYVTKGIRAGVTLARGGVVPLVSESSRAASKVDDWLKALQDANPSTPTAALIQFEAGIKQGLNGPQVDIQKFDKFMRTNPAAKRLVDELINEEDAGKIFSKTFRGQGTTDAAYALSKAKTEDQVIAAMMGAYSYGDTPLSRNIGLYAPRVTVMKPIANLKEFTKRSRMLARVPDRSAVYSGDDQDNIKAVNNFADSLRANGNSKQDIDEFTTVAVNALRTGGSAVDKYQMDILYNTFIEKSLTQNKVKKEVIDGLLEKNGSAITMMRSYFRDRIGNDTDAGFMQAMLNVPAIKNSMLPQTYNDLINRLSTSAGGFGADLHFEGAIQHLDLINRSRILPDPRELRRLTRNPLITKALAALPGGGTAIVGGKNVRLASIGKLPILSSTEKMEVITNRIRYSEIDREKDAIRSLYSSMNQPLPGTAMTEISKLDLEQEALRKVKSVRTGEQRALATTIELLQTELWKRMTLMTGGYYIRNAIDAQVRMTFAGTGSIIRHPFEYISLVIGRKSSKDIFGESLMAGGKLADENAAINQLAEELRDRMANTTRIKGLGSADFAKHLKGLGTFADVRRTMPKNGVILHTEGVVQQLAKINRSPLSKVAARSMLASSSRNIAIDRIVKAMKSPKNEKVYNDIKKLFKNGIEEADEFGNSVVLPSVDIDDLLSRPGGAAEVREILKVYAEKIVLGNAETQTGNLDAIRFVAGYDAVPSVVNGSLERLAINIPDLTDPQGVKLAMGKIDIGQEVIMKDGRNGVIIQTSKGIATVVPVLEKGSLTRFRAGTKNLQALIKETPTWDEGLKVGLPEVVSREITGSTKEDRDIWAKMSDHMDKATNWFFIGLNARSSRVLERSPVFRTYYYENVLENVDDLSLSSATAIASRLKNLAAKEGVDVDKFIGNKKLMPKLEKIIANPNHPGNLKMDELDQYAKALSLNRMEELLFDASNTNNLKDVLRIVVPFGNAWSEVVSHYASDMLVDGVHKYRTFQRFYSGATNADPDQDGRGFFYKDPQTNELMFSFPMSGSISKLVTGGDYTASLSAPVKRLSQGINVYPGIGPFAQVAANRLIADTPQNDEIRAMLLPYGAPTALSSVLPGWAVKLNEAIAADQTKTTGVYANTWFETIKAEANTGQYDLSLPQEIARLKDNAADKARWLTIMRVGSQFFGPTSGQSEFKIPTDSGDVYVREIVKEFYDMQMEDYDSAIERFLKLHGENAALYVSSKSQANTPGLETTDDFSDWTRNNADLVESYSRTANFLAPSFGEFEFKAEERQTARGDRERLTAEQQIALAQNRIGSSRYRAAKLALGPYLSKDQAARLAEFRVSLSQKYPGFKPKAEFVTNVYENDLVELGKLIADPRVGWNPAVPTIKQYLDLRSSVIASSGMKTLSSKKMASAREQLFIAGETFAKTNPYFDRIWQRLLAQEVED